MVYADRPSAVKARRPQWDASGVHDQDEDDAASAAQGAATHRAPARCAQSPGSLDVTHPRAIGCWRVRSTHRWVSRCRVVEVRRRLRRADMGHAPHTHRAARCEMDSDTVSGVSIRRSELRTLNGCFC